MTTSLSVRVRVTGNPLSWARRTRRSPVVASAADRERARLRHQNRKDLEYARYRVELQQFWARR